MAREDQVASDLGAIAVANSGVDTNSLDMIIGASNYGDMVVGDVGYPTCDFVPSLASRVARKTGLVGEGKYFKSFDLIDACAGGLESMFVAEMYIRNNMFSEINKAGVVAMETLFRVGDTSSKDILLLGEGGAFVALEGVESDRKEGILSCATQTVRYFVPKLGIDSKMEPVTDCSKYITSGVPNNPALRDGRRCFKMLGPFVKQVASEYVPLVARRAMERAGVGVDELKLLIFHQANADMVNDMALGSGVRADDLDRKVPITNDWLANQSLVSTPTILDLVYRGKLTSPKSHVYSINPGDKILIATVGGGISANAMVYQEPMR